MRNPTRSERLHLLVGLNEHWGFNLGWQSSKVAAASEEVK
jgi:hypothetical protein